MVRSVILARIHDGLPLAASMDDDQLDKEFPDYKAKTKSVVRSFSSQNEPMCSIEAGNFFFQYKSIKVKYFSYSFSALMKDGVGFVCICDKIYPKRLAYAFLDDLARQFAQDFSREQIESASRPYAFIRFDTYIQKARRSYQDVRAQHNLSRLQNELVDVQHVMQTSIQEVLDRGNKLEHMSLLSSNLSNESRKFAKDARQLNIDMLYRKYGPPSIVLAIIIVFVWIWYKWL